MSAHICVFASVADRSHRSSDSVFCCSLKLLTDKHTHSLCLFHFRCVYLSHTNTRRSPPLCHSVSLAPPPHPLSPWLADTLTQTRALDRYPTESSIIRSGLWNPCATRHQTLRAYCYSYWTLIPHTFLFSFWLLCLEWRLHQFTSAGRHSGRMDHQPPHPHPLPSCEGSADVRGATKRTTNHISSDLLSLRFLTGKCWDWFGCLRPFSLMWTWESF